MNQTFEKKFAAKLSVFSNTSLVFLKIVAGILSGSISVLSEAMHSLCDLLASVIAYISIKKASEPADVDHPFGHGKFEDLAGFVEAILIIMTAVYILWTGFEKIFVHKAPEFDTSIGIWVMLASVVANFFVSRYLYKVAKKTDSIALYTDAGHLSADIYSSVAVLLGLVAVKLTGCYYIDPIFAIIVGLIIFKTGFKLVKEAMNNLLDASLPEADLNKIKTILNDIEIKSLKTSKSGCNRNIQLEIELDPDITLKDAHEICCRLENEISHEILNTKIIIHPEPFANQQK